MFAPIVESPSAPVLGRWQADWPSEAAAQAFAQRLATQPALANACLALVGDLGAGKTTLVRHLLRALGVQGRIKSPTYAVLEAHQSNAVPWLTVGQSMAIWHFDFYRFEDPREWEDAGFRELLAGPGLKLVEWPQRAANLVHHWDAEITLVAWDPAVPACATATNQAHHPSTLLPFQSPLGPNEEPDSPQARHALMRAFSPTGLLLLPNE